MRPADLLGIFIAMCLMAIHQTTAKTCRTNYMSFPQFKNSGSTVRQKMSSVAEKIWSKKRKEKMWAKNCYDENPDTFCMTKDEEYPFFMIGYKTPVKITKVMITVRKDEYWQRAKNMVVVVSDTKPTRGKLALSSGTQIGSTFEGPAEKGGQVITFASPSGVTGKYVIVQQQYKGIMNLAEVHVNPPDVYMSSQNHENYPAENCIDGSADTFCHTKKEENPYILIDYTKPIKVNDVKVTTRKKCCWDRVKQLTVIVTNVKPSKGKSALGTGSQLGSTFTGPATSGGQVITFNSTNEVTGRYLVIQQQYEGIMNLAEVQVNKEYNMELYRKMMRKDYTKCINNYSCKGCYKVIENYLPDLLEADMIRDGEIPVFGTKKGDWGRWDWKKHTWAYTLTLLKGDDIITKKVKDQLVTINGTVGYTVAKRPYVRTKKRITGLYAGPGDIVTITFPEEVIGKIRIFIGHQGFGFNRRFLVTRRVQKFGSPFGGLLLVWMNAYRGDNSPFRGEFTIKVDGAIKAPTFTYGVNTNEQWNTEIKHYSPKWANLRIPGQVIIFVQTLYIKQITDIEASVTRIKKTYDNLQEFVGIPAGSQPGEESIRFSPGGANVRNGICEAGESNVGDKLYTEEEGNYTSYYDDFFKKYGVNDLVGHENGHGWCVGDILPPWDHSSATLIAAYAGMKSGRLRRSGTIASINESQSLDLNFDWLQRMVSFKLYSNGKTCHTTMGIHANTKQNPSKFVHCGYYIEHAIWQVYSWDIVKDVNTLYAHSKTSWRNRPDRIIDLYCQASKHNLIPFFDLFNSQPKDETIKDNCQKLPKPDVITKWLEIVECVKQNMPDGSKDIRDCAKMPHFPKHPDKGLCVISGICHNDETNGGKTTTMNKKFDLDGAQSSSNGKENCFKRASDYHKKCKNNNSEQITATFYDKEIGDGFDHTFPAK